MIHVAKGKFSQPRITSVTPPEPEESFLSAPAAELIPSAEDTPIDAPAAVAMEPEYDMAFEDSNPISDENTPSSSRQRKVVLISLCAAIALLLVAVITGVCVYLIRNADDGLIFNNVTVAGINIGGKTPEEAKTALHLATDLTYAHEDMIVVLPGTTLVFSPSDTNAQLNVDAVVEAAYNYGRTGTREENQAIKAKSLVSVHHIALLPYLTLDTGYIRSAIDEFGVDYNSDFLPSSATLEGEKPELNAAKEEFNPDAPGEILILQAGCPGRYMDPDEIYNQVLDAYSFNEFLVTIEPESEEILPDELNLQELYDLYCSEAVDAEMDKETFEVIPEIYGYGFDLDAAQEQLDALSPGDTLEIPLELIAPEVLGESLRELLFRDVLGSYETTHGNDANRNTNIRLACESIDGMVLNPGDTFDFNKALGKRTEQAGYKPADAYSNGETVKSLGGGICQVSSTLYYCTLIADLEIVARTNHSYVSSYMPKGLDATVSWGGPEFRFKNNTNYPIRIEAEDTGSRTIVKLIGTDEKDYYVKMEIEVLETIEPETIVQTMTPDNEKGYQDGQVIQTPYTGFKVKTYKCKYDKETNKLISREVEATSIYKKRDKIVVAIENPATEPPETEAPTTPTDPPEPTTPPDPTEVPVPDNP